jgi:hypothetical protein
METGSSAGYTKVGQDGKIGRAVTGVFSNGWESFKLDWESVKLDWGLIERELKTMDRQHRERFVERAKEAAVRLKAIVDPD